MLNVLRPRLRRYGIAGLVFVLALLLKLLLELHIEVENPFLLFFPAVMFSTWYGGLGPGLLAMIATGLLSYYFFVDPDYLLLFSKLNQPLLSESAVQETVQWVLNPGQNLQLGLFALQSLLFGWLAGVLRLPTQHHEPFVGDREAFLQKQIAERQRAIETLHRREQDFRTLLENSPDAIARFNRELRYVYVNRVIEQILGVSRQTIIGKTIPELLMPNKICLFWEEKIRQVFATATEQEIEFEFETPIGVRAYQSRLVPEVNAKGVTESVLVLSHDITENKQAEQKRSQLIREQAVRATAQMLEKRSAFLAQASKILASSLDYDTTLANVARLAIPFLADYCLIFKLEGDGQLRQVTAYHQDPQKQAWVDKLAHLYQISLENSNSLVANVLQTGESMLVSELSYEMATSITQDDRLLEIYRELNPNSCIVIPLVARSQVFGCLMLATTQSGRYYDASDLALAEDLSQRAALAIDNARLYQETQQALQYQAELLFLIDALLVAAPLAVGFLDKELRYLRINQVLAAINGFSIEEHLGRSFRDLLPEMAVKFEPQLQRVLDTGEPILNVEISGEAPGKPGHYGYWLGNYYPVRDAQGQTVGIGIILVEITQTKQAEATAQAATRKVANILESITDACFAVDREWRFTFINHHCTQIMGHSQEQLLGQCFWEVFPQSVGSIYYEHYQKALREQRPVHFESPGAYDSGRWFDIRAYPSADGLAVYFQEITDRKKAEEALRQSEERFRVALKNSPIMVYNQDRDLHYTWFHNPHFSCTPESLIGKTDWEIAPADVATQLTHIKQQVLQTGVGTRDEIQIVLDGVLCSYDLTVEPLYGEAGAIAGITGAAVDITDRKQAEEALREGEARFRVMFDQAAVGIALVALDGRFLQVNSALSRITGYSCDELLVLCIQDISHPDDQALDVTHLQRVLAREIEGYSVEKRYYCKDGSMVWVNVTVSLVWDSQGQPKYGIGIIEDISARKRAQATQQFLVEASTLLAASLDYETTLNNVAHLAVPLLADWCIVDMFQSDASVRQIAIACADSSKQEILQQLRHRYPPDPKAPNPVWQSLLNGESIIYPEFTEAQMAATARNEEHLQLLQKLGRRSVMIVPIQSRHQVLGVLSFASSRLGHRYNSCDLALAQDIARRAASAIDNARLYQEAQEANRMKDEFLAVLSHELRSPLNAILGWTQMLRTRQFNESATARALETIERNARLQTQLIEDLLDVSRIIRGQLALNLRSISLVSVIEAAINTVRPAADAKGIKITSTLPSTVGLISGDPDRLQQVVWNLLSNAIKFTPQGGRVKIRLDSVVGNAASRLYAEIQVTDTGKGISPEFLPHVFDRFRQADSTTTRSYGGLGLGLAIVRHLVELHGGTVRAESSGEGQGATFIVQLPLQEESRGEWETRTPTRRGVGKQESGGISPDRLVSAPVTPMLSRPLSGLRVLVVDDEADTRDYLITVLEEYGAQVTGVASASQALLKIEQVSPDVLVSDVGMPGEDGHSLIRKVRALKSRQNALIPAIAVTAYARDEDRKKAIAAGFQMHLAKPVEPEQLVAVVATLTGRQDTISISGV